jgi:hypothetical protein
VDVYLADLLRGVGVIGLTCGLFWMLATGRLAVGRELREKNERIVALEATLKVRDHQLSLVLSEAMTTISPVLKAMRAAIDADEEAST